MARKELQVASVSRAKKPDAGDTLRIPLKPFLAILHQQLGNIYFRL